MKLSTMISAAARAGVIDGLLRRESRGPLGGCQAGFMANVVSEEGDDAWCRRLRRRKGVSAPAKQELDGLETGVKIQY